jgi:hypothetical protein
MPGLFIAVLTPRGRVGRLARSLALAFQGLSAGRGPGCVWLLIAAAGSLAAAGQADARAEEAQGTETRPLNFAREILPILSSKCFVCHGPDAEEGMLRLDNYQAATEDRGGYFAIPPADAVEQHRSELVVRIEDESDPMPPRDAEMQLTEVERHLLIEWASRGGAYERHWAFVPPIKVDISENGEPVHGKGTLPAALPGALSGAIDHLIARGLTEAGVDFAPEAERNVLARRTSLVLTGLPPEPQWLQAFLADSEPDAFERYVDLLLASERFGEHQARYWLDAVRYGDTHGLHLDNRRGIYPYRDWVIRAMNHNLPWDQFIQWQLAGDLLPSPTLEQLVATGYVRMNPTTSEGGVIPAEFQAKNNFDRTETLGTVFLGLTLSCARCHTHKYDPIPHTEYYQLFAFFNSTQESPLDGNKYDYAPTIKAPRDLDAWSRWDEIQAQRKVAVAESRKKLESLKEQLNKALDGSVVGGLDQQEQALLGLQKSIGEAQGELSKLLESEQWTATTLVAAELPESRPTQVLKRGEYDLPVGEPLEPAVPLALSPMPAGAPANRLGLAQWLTSRDNPLVARVLVNRLWQQVYGYALVRTPEDFGLQGEQPTHPELLDWLAVDFQESGWDMKRLIKGMILSRTYRQSSAWRSEIDDPENRLFARGSSYRLDAEVIRDTGLWASGLLDPTMGGEGVKPYQPDGMWEALAHPASNTKQYERDRGERLYRRSIYVYWKRTSPHPMMTLFDAPSREASCVRRSRTSTSLQSLGLLNETQRIEMARKLAERLLVVAEDDRARVERLFNWLVCRPPNARELSASTKLIDQMRKRYLVDVASAGLLLASGDAPVNSELSPSEIAAWTQLTAAVLASDAAIMLY